MSNTEVIDNDDYESVFNDLVDEKFEDTANEEVEEKSDDVDESTEVVDEEAEDDIESDEPAEGDDDVEEEDLEEDSEESEEEESEEDVEEKEEESDADKRARELEEEVARVEAEKQALARQVNSFVDYNDVSKEDALIDLGDLPDVEIGSGEDKTTLKEFADEYPVMMEAVNVLLGSTIQKFVGSNMEPVKEILDDLSFRTRLSAVHPDGMQIISDPAFSKWVNGASKGIKTLASTGDVSDAGLVLDEYKKTLASKEESKPKVDKEKKKAVNAKKAKKKSSMKALLSDNLKSKQVSSPDSDPESLSEADFDKMVDEFDE